MDAFQASFGKDVANKTMTNFDQLQAANPEGRKLEHPKATIPSTSALAPAPHKLMTSPPKVEEVQPPQKMDLLAP